jgi:hypothetical protein
VGGQQLLLAQPVLGLPHLVHAGPGPLHLDADELAAWVAALLQPVGEDQADVVVVGVLDDGLDKSLLEAHAGPPDTRPEE